MKLFVTGTQSFIGKEVLKQCEAQSVEITGIDLNSANRPHCQTGDIREKNLHLKIPRGVDAVIHLAAMSRDADCRQNAYACVETNVLGTLNVMEAAWRRGARQFIFASTEWVYDRFQPEALPKKEDDPIDIANLNSEYALSKLVSEANLRQRYQQGFCPVTILRFGIIYGPRKQNWSAVESLLHAVATQDEVTVGSLQTSRQFLHVSDVAAAIISAVGQKGFEIINIQGRVPITLGEIIQVSKTLLGKNPPVVESTPDAPSIRRIANHKAKQLLNWQPAMDLEPGLQTVIDYLKLTQPGSA